MSQAIFQIAEKSDSRLTDLMAAALKAIEESIRSLVDKDVTFTADRPNLINEEGLGDLLGGRWARLHGEFDKDFEGTVHILFEWKTALTFSGFIRMNPEEVVASTRDLGEWKNEDDEAFGEVGNILFSALDEALRGGLDKKINIRSSGMEKYEEGVSGFLGEDPHIGYPFRVKIADFPEEPGYIFMPLDTAEAMNGQPIRFHGEDDDLEDLEDIEEAPIRGEMSIYAQEPAVLKALRKCCRRIGLVFDRRPKGEVPNPAAHEGKVVFLELGPGQEKRLEWCLRLKESGRNITVAILLLEPTKRGVVLAFKAMADVILGWPTKERSISGKLAEALEGTRSETTG